MKSWAEPPSDLVRDAATREPQAIERLVSWFYEHYEVVDGDRMQGLVLRFVKLVVDRGPGFLVQIRSFKAFLSLLAARARLDQLRREKRHPAVSVPDPDRIVESTGDPAAHAAASDIAAILVRTCQAMPALQRELYVRHDLEGESMESIANSMRPTLTPASVNALRGHLYRARAIVRAVVGESYLRPESRRDTPGSK